jgi:hypothetical protein
LLACLLPCRDSLDQHSPACPATNRPSNKSTAQRSHSISSRSIATIATMKFVSSAVLLLLASSASAFAPAVDRRPAFALRMSSEEVTSPPPSTASIKTETASKPPAAASSSSASTATMPSSSALVPIKEETVEFTAGLLGGLAGLFVGGPALAAVGAACANYVSKMEVGEATDVIQAVSKSSIQVYNYLTTLDGKYELLKKAQDSLQSSLDKLKAQGSVDPETVTKVETALSNTRSKIAEINDEYDLVGGGLTALGVIGDLVEKAINKVGELNSEYKISDRALESLRSAVSRASGSTKV